MTQLGTSLAEMLEIAWGKTYNDQEEAQRIVDGFLLSIRQAENIYTEREVKMLMFRRQVVLGGVAYHKSELAVGLKLLQNVLDDLEKDENPVWLGRAHGTLGVIYRQLGERPLAAEHLIRRLEIGEQINDADLQSASCNSLGIMYADAEEYDEAISYFKRGLPYARQVGEMFGLIFCLSNLADSLVSDGRAEEARPYLQEAIERCAAPKYAFPRCIPIHQTARVEATLGNFYTALDYYAEADALNRQSGNDYTQIKIHLGRGELFMLWERPHDAVKEFQAALTISDETGNRPLGIVACEKLADALIECDAYKESAVYYRRLNEDRTAFINERTELRVRSMRSKYEVDSARREADWLQKQNQNLELRVAERTVDLEAMAAELRAAYEREQAVNKLKSRIINTVSHEFRTPLTIISTSTHMLKRNWERLPNTKREELNERITESIRTLTMLINDMNWIDTVQTDAVSPVLNAIPFNHLCNSLQRDNRPKVAPELLTFVYDASDVTSIHTDYNLLNLILSKLIDNAILYNVAPPAPITITFDCSNDWLVLTVKDDGIGVPVQERGKIFEVLYRGSNVETRPGLGTGLYIAQRMAEMLGGEIRVVSAGRSQGSKFIVSLPNA